MALDVLSTSSINSFINTFKINEQNKLLNPLKTKKTKYTTLSSSYGTLSSKLSALQSELANLKLTGTDSIFKSKLASSSNSDFVTATATTSASNSGYDIRVSQLAKSDVALSKDFTAATANSITGTHSFIIKTGDGSTGEYVSNVDVTFTSGETNQTVLEKIRDAINSDKAVVTSSAKTASSSYSGSTASITINIDGTETVVSVNGGGTYEDLINELVSNINNNITDVTAEKVLDSPSTGDVKLKITVNDSSKYITITNTSGFDLVSDLNIAVTKEKGASGLVTASAFSPSSSNFQLSLTAKQTGVDNRITELSDSGSSTALSNIGLNFGTSRPTFDQSTSPDTAGYLYSDITSANTLLNSKITFNGLSIQRNSNTISDLVDGVTFNLKAVMNSSDLDANITVGNDVSTIKSKLESFITKFNDLYTYLVENSKSKDGNRGTFQSDANASSLLSTLRSLSYTKVAGISDNDINLLSEIGISFNTETGLSISDDTTLTKKLTDNIDQVEALFNSTNGIAVTLHSTFSPFLGAAGYLAASQSTFDNNASDLDDRISAAQKRIDKSTELMRNNLERMQAQLASLIQSQNLFGNGGSFF